MRRPTKSWTTGRLVNALGQNRYLIVLAFLQILLATVYINCKAAIVLPCAMLALSMHWLADAESRSTLNWCDFGVLLIAVYPVLVTIILQTAAGYDLAGYYIAAASIYLLFRSPRTQPWTAALIFGLHVPIYLATWLIQAVPRLQIHLKLGLPLSNSFQQSLGPIVPWGRLGNGSAVALVSLIVFSYARELKGAEHYAKLLNIVSGIAVILMIASQSKGIMLSLGFYLLSGVNYKRWSVRRGFAFFCCLVMCGVALYLTWQHWSTSDRTHLTGCVIAIKLLFRHPLGLGLNGFIVHTVNLNQAFNSFLEYVVDTGLAGMFFLFVMIVLSSRVVKLRLLEPRRSALSRGLLAIALYSLTWSTFVLNGPAVVSVACLLALQINDLRDTSLCAAT